MCPELMIFGDVKNNVTENPRKVKYNRWELVEQIVTLMLVHGFYDKK